MTGLFRHNLACQWYVLLVVPSMFWTSCLPTCSADEFPSPSEWIEVDTVSEEYDYVKQQRCDCGGSLEVESQGTGKKLEKHYDVLNCACTRCGTARPIVFDVTSIFQKHRFSSDADAKREAFARLDRQWPSETEVPLDELKKLFGASNPHVRTWAAGRLAQTAGGADLLLDSYLTTGILGQVQLRDTLTDAGPSMVASIAKRLKLEDDEEARQHMIWLLADLDASEARPLVETQLRSLLPDPSHLRRACYIALGTHGDKRSEALLLKALESETDPPDDSLIWALARCGSDKSFGAIREYFRLPPGATQDQQSLWLAAIAAEGIIGDREAIPDLLKIAKSHPKSPSEDAWRRQAIERLYREARHNAIYALGQLGAVEAVPLLIEHLREVPDYEYYTSPNGLYGEDGLLRITDSHVLDAIRALVRIGATDGQAKVKKQVLPEFRRILKDDRFYLDHDEVAKAAAQLGWRELVADIVRRLEEDYEYHVDLFGEEREEYAPPLRKLTGQSFGEDPEPWRKWLDETETKKASGG